MNKLNSIEKRLLKDILQDATNSDDFETYIEIISNIYRKLGLK